MKKLLYLVVSVFIIACNNDDNDSTAPVVTLIGESSITVSQSSTYEDAGATATDNQDGDLTSSIVTTSNLDTSTLGAYTVVHSVSDAAGNVGSVSRQVDVGMSNPSVYINVLWQSPPAWDSITAMKIAAINPAKLIISISGGGTPPASEGGRPASAGPDKNQLIQFITWLTAHGYTGELVMHPDIVISSWNYFWTDSISLPYTNPATFISDNLWHNYIDYFNELNAALVAVPGLRPMTELLIETGSGSTMSPSPGTSPGNGDLYDLFTSFKTYMNDSSVTISATGDWLSKYFPTSADHYYAQMYDMCYTGVGNSQNGLCGENIFSTERAKLIAESMVQFIMAPSPNGIGNNSGGLDKVSFIFTYAPTVTTNLPPGRYNSPMFGEGNNFWTKSQFTNSTIMENDAIKQTGFIWWFKTKMDVHYSQAGLSGRASTGLWHSEAILDARWNTIP